MANKVTGVISHIGETTQVTATFAKRDLVLTVQNGDYENLNAFQLVNKGCEMGDKFTEGEIVAVYYNIRSNEKDGRYFTSLTAWKVEPDEEAPAPKAVAKKAPAMVEPVYEQEGEELPF